MAAPAPANRKRFVGLLAAGALVVLFGSALPRLMLAPDPPVTAGKTSPGGPPTAEAPHLGTTLLRLAICGVVLVGLCILFARVYGRRSEPAVNAGMELLAALPVDTRCVVYLVQAGPRRLLVGVDHTGVKTLVELPGPAPAVPIPSAAESVTPGFPAALAGLLTRRVSG